MRRNPAHHPHSAFYLLSGAVMAWLCLSAFLTAGAVPILAISSTPGQVPAQQAGPQGVEITFETGDPPGQAPITAGDEIVLVLEIRHPGGSTAVIPALPAQWGAFEVRSQSGPLTRTQPDGSLFTRQEIRAALFEPGQQTSPPFDVTIQGPDGTATETAVPPLTVEVQSVLSEDDLALRDLKPQARMQTPFPWAWVLAGLLGMAILAAAWRAGTRGQETAEPPAADPAVSTPQQRALAQLEQIEALDLPARGQSIEHYTRIAAALQHFLEEHFTLETHERTPEETLQATAGVIRQSALLQEIRGVFVHSEQVKFGQASPSPEQARASLEQTRRLVTILASSGEPDLAGADASETNGSEMNASERQ